MRSKALAALVLLAAACGSSTAHPGSPATTTIATPGPTSTVQTPPVTPRTIVVGGSSAVPATTAAPATTALRATNSGPGGAAAVYLRPSGASHLTLEVQSQQGAEPRQASVDHLVSVLGQVAHKTVGTITQPAPGGSRSWDDAALQSTAGGQTAGVIHILFLHGTYKGDDSVLGISIRNDLAAIFIDQVSTSSVEKAVTTHELGHLLGLVDLFLHTGRDDPQHPHHSKNPQSVMYWAVESSLVGQLLNGPPPTEFDAQDQADVAAIRSGSG